MRKSRSKAAYMISAVAEQYDIHPQTLRLYEREGLLAPSRSEGNTRLYTDDDIERLEVILKLTRDFGVNLAGVEIKIVVLGDPLLRDVDIVGHLQAGVFDCFPGAGHRTAVDDQQPLGRARGIDHAADMGSDAGQAVDVAQALTRELDGCGVGDLAAVRAARTGQDHHLIGFAKALFRHRRSPWSRGNPKAR